MNDMASCCNNASDKDDVSRNDVQDFYSKAAITAQESLCCPTEYDSSELSHIPKEVLEISYGCGSPVGRAGLQEGQTISFELGGCRKRYNVGLARTIHLGEKEPQELSDTSKAVQEGMFEVMNVLKADVIASDVYSAWQKVLNKYNLVKKSRIGYSIGLSYSPD